MPSPCRNRLRPGVFAAALLAAALCAAHAHAATVYDWGKDPKPLLPNEIDLTNSHVYITNKAAAEGGEGEEGEEGGEGEAPAGRAAPGELDYLRIGQYSQLHIGYDNTGVATGDIAIPVTGNAQIDGSLFMGKGVTSGEPGRPDAATTKVIGVTVNGDMVVNPGGKVVLYGAGEDAMTSLTTDTLTVDGGTFTMEQYSNLTVGIDNPPNTPTGQSLRIQNGGVLNLNSGLPPPAEEDGGGEEPPGGGEEPPGGGEGEGGEGGNFGGITVTEGSGILIDNGGTLAAGSRGGQITLTNTQKVTVAKGGFLDAGKGSIAVATGGGVDIAGGYRAGYNAAADATTRLTNETGDITFSSGSSIALSRDLQRHLNADGRLALPGAILAETGGSILFENGAPPPTLQTGMGAYRLGLDTSPGAEDAPYNALVVTGVDGAVTGNRRETDRQLFQGNMGKTWGSSAMNRSVSDNIYNLVAAEAPSIEAQNAEGQFNQAVLEALVDGQNQAIVGRGVADGGVFEMYTGASQWGANNAAMNTATEFMSGLDRRVERVGAELDRLGEGWGEDPSSEDAYGSIMDNMNAPGERFWLGGFGRNEDADLDYGIAGYTYRPRGFMLGYDKIMGDFALGAAAAYGRGAYEDKAATQNDSTITSYSAGVFATYHNAAGLNATAHAAASLFDNDLSDTRGGMRRTADYSGYAWSIGARVGYDKMLADRLMFSPSVGISKAKSVGRGHDESLGGTGVIRVGEATRDSTLAPIDLTLSYDIIRQPTSVLRLTGNFGYAYDFNDGALDGTFRYEGLAGSSAMTFADREPGQHRFNLGAGLIYTGTKFDLGARYDYFKRSDQTTHQARGSLGVKF